MKRTPKLLREPCIGEIDRKEPRRGRFAISRSEELEFFSQFDSVFPHQCLGEAHALVVADDGLRTERAVKETAELLRDAGLAGNRNVRVEFRNGTPLRILLKAMALLQFGKGRLHIIVYEARTDGEG